jgi:uncharacterized damage-inducible protein DinB
MQTDDPLRTQLAKLLDWGEAHADFDKAVADLPAEMRGRRPDRFPHSVWELVEHIRLAQHEILEFCHTSDYEELRWPEGYWPTMQAPPHDNAWERSLEGFRHDRQEFQSFVSDPALDLTARIPHGTGQTYLRELLLAADHTSYHVGQIIAVRRLLGAWPA